MDKNISHIVDRLRNEFGYASDTEVATALGMTKTALYNHKSRSSIPYEALSTFCDNEGLSFDWLLTGEGPKRRNEATAELPEGAVKIDIYALAGAGNPKDLVTDDPIESIVLPAEFSGQNIVPVKVKGMSMFPTIWDGALVGVDRAERGVISGEIYAVWMPYEGAVIKRLFMEMDKVLIRSDNKEFPSFTIPYVELENGSHGDNFILGRVKWIIQKR